VNFKPALASDLGLAKSVQFRSTATLLILDAAALDFPERSTRGRCCCAAVQHWWIGEVAAAATAAEAAAPLVGLGLICIGP